MPSLSARLKGGESFHLKQPLPWIELTKKKHEITTL